jgi:hypothetical protein
MDACEEFDKKLDAAMDTFDIRPENFMVHFMERVMDSLVEEVEGQEYEKLKIDPMIFSYAFSYGWGKNYKDSFLVKIDGVEYKPSNSAELYDVLCM